MKYLATLLIYLYSCTSYAINVGSVTSYIYSDEDTVYKTVRNDSDEARLILVSVEEISRPDKDGKVLNKQPKDLLLTPSKLILPSQSANNVRFFYQGPQDRKERYYRIYWTDTNLSQSSSQDSPKEAIASTTAVIGTILVVNPRKENFQYHYENKKLKNIGNSSYRVVAYGPCLEDKNISCRENYNELPTNTRVFQRVDLDSENSFIGIWHKKKFIIVK
ncbi:hypothetical protein [Vibrio cincinnatiensis]|jgi:hypothetical protein|uniref:EcpB family pilus assembly chaperone n=1 Tax=Vibrio cincinnatiensis TaxID=675 RepID=UPI001302887C|nr:hypothetical protein [Vibrio cincinnatiensis]